jgi:hypothetical protein
LDNDRKHIRKEYFKLANSPLVVASFHWSLFLYGTKVTNTLEGGGGEGGGGW